MVVHGVQSLKKRFNDLVSRKLQVGIYWSLAVNRNDVAGSYEYVCACAIYGALRLVYLKVKN